VGLVRAPPKAHSPALCVATYLRFPVEAFPPYFSILEKVHTVLSAVLEIVRVSLQCLYLVVHSMSCVFSKSSYERCRFLTSCEASIASEHDVDISIRRRMPRPGSIGLHRPHSAPACASTSVSTRSMNASNSSREWNRAIW
jgi:hypothetical protein